MVTLLKKYSSLTFLDGPITRADRFLDQIEWFQNDTIKPEIVIFSCRAKPAAALGTAFYLLWPLSPRGSIVLY